jgi:predicted ATPase
VIYSELVGRDNELNKLNLQVMKAINGEGSIVNIIGDPGIGKSRLIAELKKKDEIKKVTLLEGRALAIGKNLSFHPLIDIFKGWASIREDDSEAESIEKLEKAIMIIYPHESAEVFPFIATLMGMKLTGRHAQRLKGIEGEALEKLILKSIRELIVKAAELRPTVFILENLHWSDLTTIEFLESLLRLATEHRILFINVFRPNYKETSDRLLGTIKEKYDSYNTEIYLKALDKYQCEVLTNNLMRVKAFPTAIRKQIITRTEGNPFFIEEVVQSFIDQGIVEVKDGAFKVTHKIDTAIIPETIQDVLMARIDKLDEETKDLLKVASVIGRHFFYRILAEVARPIEDLDSKLEYLKEAQLIREGKRMGEIEYLFKHGLTQETTYNSILLSLKSCGCH